jgi:DNA-binding YbaB/EbfC family protein
MQQMMMQAQKLQRELKKAKDELAKKEFTVSKSGLVTVTMLGDRTITELTIDEDGFEKDNKEMVEELIISAVNELYEKISKAETAIEEKITGRAGGFGF